MEVLAQFSREHGEEKLREVLAFANKVLAERPDTDWGELAEMVTALFPKVLLPDSRRERELFFMALRHGAQSNLIITCDPKRRAREAWSMKCLAGGLIELKTFVVGQPVNAV